jgi:hypothetical protein
MSFRADEDAEENLESTIEYLTDGVKPDGHKYVSDTIRAIAKMYGPVVRSYPIWHPLVNNSVSRDLHLGVNATPINVFRTDHTVYFANAVLSTNHGRLNERMLDLMKFTTHEAALFHISRYSGLYADGATSALLSCRFNDADLSEEDGKVRYAKASTRSAVGMMLQSEVPAWIDAECAEPWNVMRPYLLGEPCGAVSSHFVSEETGVVMRRVWNTLVAAGLWGKDKYTPA